MQSFSSHRLSATLLLTCLSSIHYYVGMVHASEAIAMSPRIINGQAADRATYPRSMVYLADGEEQLKCGGTLISPTIVLAAAHCATEILEYVVVGRYNRANPLEDFDTIPIVEQRIHPNFDLATMDHDVLLLQIERPTSIDIGDFMLLNSISGVPPVGTNLLALGWGDTQQTTFDPDGSPILQAVNLTSISNKECGSKVNQDEDYRGLVLDSMLCTFRQNADHCFGDSGGPILVVSPVDSSVFMQVGIISWGADRCADGFFPGVSQRVSRNYEWIAAWVCALDGQDLATKERYACKDGQTFSPMPSPAPIAHAISIEGRIDVVNFWIELFMDEWPEDIRWTITENTTGVQVATSPSYEGNTDDLIVEQVELAPGRTFKFTITDGFGDGFLNGGFYRLSLGGADLLSADVLFSGNLKSKRVLLFDTPEPNNVAPSPSPNTSFRSCLHFGETCVANGNCCSGKCNLGQCLKS